MEKKVCALCAVVCAGSGLSLTVAGVNSSACVSVKRLDHGHEGWEATDCRWQDGRLMLKKDTEGSAAFLVTFGEDVNR